MKLTKSPPELMERFARALPEDPRVARRPMFGYPSGTVNGNMFAGTFGDDAIVKIVGEPGVGWVLSHGGEPFCPAPGKVMGGFWVVPRVDSSDLPRLREWVQRAFDCVSILPAKGEGKPTKSMKTKKKFV